MKSFFIFPMEKVEEKGKRCLMNNVYTQFTFNFYILIFFNNVKVKKNNKKKFMFFFTHR